MTTHDRNTGNNDSMASTEFGTLQFDWVLALICVAKHSAIAQVSCSKRNICFLHLDPMIAQPRECAATCSMLSSQGKQKTK